jgi:outer membrane protein assembly factor BamB
MYLKRPGLIALLRKKSLALSCLLFVSILLGISCQRSGNPAREAKRIIARSGVEGGLVVHYQCGDGQLTSALKRNERYTVHGLDSDQENIADARTYFESAALNADVSVMEWDSPFLPYTDNLVNLFIAEKTPDVPMQEILRVLVPGGVALIAGKKTVKPRPQGMDEWNQTRYDHTNNGVSNDSVGPPRFLRWAAGPAHARSHEENSSTMAVVTANGRLFYIQDEGLIGVSDPRLPSDWKLIARDAFNGRLLWKRPIPEWGWQVWEQQKKEEIWTTKMAQRHQFPAGMARRLIARGDRAYMTLGYRAPVSVIDAASGKIIRTLEQTANTDEIVLVNDLLLVLQREVPAGDRNQKEEPENNPSRILAIDPDKGKTIWSLESPYIWQWSMVSDGERIFYYDGVNEMVHAVDLKTSRPLWQTPSTMQKINPAIYIGLTFVVQNGILFHMGQEQLQAYDARTGDVLWSKKGKGASAPVYHNQPSLFVTDGLLWMGGPGITEKGERMTGYDPGTGEEVRIVEPGYIITPGHHYRCFPPRATGRFIIMPKRGAEFIDLQGNESMKNDWLRGACRFGYLPSNGLFYVTPHQCFCYTGVLINGFNAFASGLEKSPGRSTRDAPRLVKGPAYRKAMSARNNKGLAQPWPMYRQNNERSGSSDADIPDRLVRRWSTNLEGKLVQPTLANGCLFIAEKSKNRIVCLDQDYGKQRWQFTADAEVDSPPTYHRGLLLFGCTDGWVYCLEADSGTLAWRYRIAPEERLIMDESRLQSAWPVHGSVIVLNDIVYAAAGRSSFLDGGIYLAGIDIYSGKPVCRGHYEGPHPDLTCRQGNGYYMDGAQNDLLVSDGEFIYLRQNKFDLELNHIPVEPTDRGYQPPVNKGKYKGLKGERNVGLHLFATGGMLDDSFWNRNYWMHSEIWPGYYIANQAPKAGQLITFDEQNTYAVKHYPRRNPHSPLNIPGKDGYLVFADRTETPLNLYDGSEETRPMDWLPTPMKVLKGGKLIGEEDPHHPAINFDKGPGFTRKTPPLWTQWHPTRFMAMSQAGNKLVLCGVPDKMPEDDPMAAFEGRLGARLVILDTRDGKTLGVFEMDEVPVFDGISIEGDRIYMAAADGNILCLGKEN